MEVIWPGRAHCDWTVKPQRDAARGVPYYWIVEPEARRLECFRLEEGHYALEGAGMGNEIVEVPDFPAPTIPLSTLWFSLANPPSDNNGPAGVTRTAGKLPRRTPRSEEPAGGVHVGRDLALERLHPRELHLRSDVREELDGEAPII